MNTDRKWKILSYITAVLSVLSAVPAVILMFYAHPFADEYIETLNGVRALRAGKGLAGIIAGAWKSMVKNYFTWQGTFTAKFLMAMNPSMFGDRYYVFGLLGVLFVFLAGTLYFLYQLFVRVLKMERYEYVIVSCITLLIGIHFMPDPTQGLYWFESSSYYIGIFGLGMASLGLTLRMTFMKGHGNASLVLAAVFAALGAFLTGGGSLQSGLMFIFAYSAVAVTAFLHHNSRWKACLFPFAASLAGTMVNVLAPGNSVRGNGSYSGIGPFMTIYKSIHQGCVFLDEWNSLFVIPLLAGVCLPLFLRSVRRTQYEFRFPVIVSIYLFGMFSCQFAPTFYAYDMLGPLRAVNPIYISFIIMMALELYYLCGWFYRRVLEEGAWMKECADAFYRWYFPYGIVTVLFLFGIGCIASDRLSYITGVSALQSLVSGEASVYHAERTEREEVFLENLNAKNEITVEDLDAKPYLLYFEDGEIKTDQESWINRGVSKYYGIKSVKRKAEEEPES